MPFCCAPVLPIRCAVRACVSAVSYFFFAPAQFMKREQEWGPGEVIRRASREAARMSLELRGALSIQRVTGAEAVARAFSRLVANEIPPSIGIIASVNS